MIARLRGTLSKVRVPLDMTDAFVFSGLGCIGYGIGQIYAPLTWITIGTALFWLGVRR
jgi:hypothetical protein